MHTVSCALTAACLSIGAFCRWYVAALLPGGTVHKLYAVLATCVIQRYERLALPACFEYSTLSTVFEYSRWPARGTYRTATSVLFGMPMLFTFCIHWWLHFLSILAWLALFPAVVLSFYNAKVWKSDGQTSMGHEPAKKPKLQIW